MKVNTIQFKYKIYMFMFLFVLLQLFPLGLTGEYHTDPLYNKSGPRNIQILSTVTPKDATTVVYKNNCGLISDQGVDIIYEEYWIEVENSKTKNKKKLILPRDQWFKLNMDKIYCIDSLDIW